MPKPRVSVIIAVKNGSSRITEAVDSILSQTYRSFEIIVIDDGSTDGTGAALARYKDNNRVTYIYQSNRGASAARNTGLRASSGEYIKFLDHDDILYPRQLELQVSDLERGESGISYSGYEMRYPDSRNVSIPVKNTANISLSRLIEGYNGPIHAYLTKRELLMRVGGFDEKLSRYEDVDVWLRLALRGAVISTVDYIGCCYRLSDKGMSADNNEMFAQRCRVFEKLNHTLIGRMPEIPTDAQRALIWMNTKFIHKCWARGGKPREILTYTLQAIEELIPVLKRGPRRLLFKLAGTENIKITQAHRR